MDDSSRGYNGAIHGIESALKRLNTNYIDLLLIHEPYKESIEMYHAMEDMYAKGILKAIGVSNFDQHHYDDLINQINIVPMVNQMESHVYYPNNAYQQYLASHGTIMQSWGPFTEGKRDIFNEPLLVNIGINHGKTGAQVALRYLYQLIIPIIPKSHHLSRNQSNIDIFDFRFNDEEMHSIETLSESNSLFDWYGSQWV